MISYISETQMMTRHCNYSMLARNPRVWIKHWARSDSPEKIPQERVQEQIFSAWIALTITARVRSIVQSRVRFALVWILGTARRVDALPPENTTEMRRVIADEFSLENQGIKYSPASPHASRPGHLLMWSRFADAGSKAFVFPPSPATVLPLSSAPPYPHRQCPFFDVDHNPLIGFYLSFHNFFALSLKFPPL